MIEDIIVDTLADNGVMEAHALVRTVMEYDCTEDEAVEALNRLYDQERIRSWPDEDGDYMVALL